MTIDKQYRYETKPFVYTNRTHKCRVSTKKQVAKIKFNMKTYCDLFMFYYAGRLFHYVQTLLTRSINHT